MIPPFVVKSQTDKDKIKNFHNKVNRAKEEFEKESLLNQCDIYAEISKRLKNEIFPSPILVNKKVLFMDEETPI